MSVVNTFVGGATLAAQFILGGVAFFLFFAAMFNGRTGLMAGAAVAGLGANLLVSTLVARRNIEHGRTAAVVFGGPALLFSVFALGDLLAQGDVAPFLFWASSALAAIGAGFLGVLVFRRNPARPRISTICRWWSAREERGQGRETPAA